LTLRPDEPASGILAYPIRSNLKTRFEGLAVTKPSSEHATSPLFRFVGVRGPLDSSRYKPGIEDDDGFPPSPPFLSTPISSYSSGTPTSGRNSENSSVVFDKGI
jgi:hypothetical protein